MGPVEAWVCDICDFSTFYVICHILDFVKKTKKHETTQDGGNAHCPIKRKLHDEPKSTDRSDSESLTEKSESWLSMQV